MICKTNIRAQIIDDTTLETYGMRVFTFSVLDKDNKERFFEENFLLAGIKTEVVLRMPFLIMSNADIDFQDRDL